MSKQESRPMAFACDLTALDVQERDRYEHVRQQLLRAVEEVREVTSGYTFRYSAHSSTLRMLAEFISLESRCCPFLGFTLEVAPQHGPVWLMLTGPEGVKAFLQAELGIDQNA